jgi:hypothetical protein
MYNFINLTKNAFADKTIHIIYFKIMFESRKISF